MVIDPTHLSTTAHMTFNEDFNAFSLWNGNTGVWQASYPWDRGWGTTNITTHELEWYINPAYGPTAAANPFSLTNGLLNITAKPASSDILAITGHPYTSGMITTAQSFAQTYGYFEMRAQMPAGQGLWPAFWLLPVDQSWPNEIDVMEMVGSKPNALSMTIHYGSYQTTGVEPTVADMTTGMHVYGVDWEPDFITWYFDGTPMTRTATPADLSKPMYLLANLAVGGDWPGAPDASTPFPATMQIDWIHAYAAGAAPMAVADAVVTSWPNIITGTTTTQVLIGTAGNDYLVSANGGNTMTGHDGHDVFFFTTLTGPITHVTDFVGGIDKIDVSAIFSTLAYRGSDAVADHYVLLTANTAGGTDVSIDPDGSAGQGAVHVATLDNIVPSLIHLATDVWFL